MPLLKNRSYVLLRTGWSISNLGSQMQNFAFSLYVLAATGSAVQFSVTLCMQILPMVLLAPLAGYLCDRFPRKRLVVLYDLLCAAAMFFFLFLRQAGGFLPVPAVYLCVLLLSSFQTLFNSPAVCLMQAVVDPADYTRQKSVDTTLTSLIAIAAPALAGVLYGLYGIGIVMAVNFISFLVSAILESFLRFPGQTAAGLENHTPFFESFREGISFIRSRAFLRMFLVTLSLLNAVEAGLQIGLTVVSQQLMKQGAAAVGAENSILSLGMLATAVWCGIHSRKAEPAGIGRMVSGSVFATASGFLLVALWLFLFYPHVSLWGNLSAFVALNLIASVSDAFLSIHLSAEFQREVPNKIMGRVAAISNAAFGACMPLGQVFAGFLFGALPFSAVYLTEGILTLFLFAYSFHQGRRSAIMEETAEASATCDAAPNAEGEAIEAKEKSRAEKPEGNQNLSGSVPDPHHAPSEDK